MLLINKYIQPAKQRQPQAPKALDIVKVAIDKMLIRLNKLMNMKKTVLF